MEKRQLFSSYTFKYILINLLPDIGYIVASQVRILVAQGFHVDFTTPCITNSRVSGFTPDVTQELVLREIIQDSHSAVYRGTLDGIPVTVKVKISYIIDEVRSEARNYFAMEELQGTIIPRCYNYVIGSALVKGETEPSDIACLILEDYGEPVKDFFCLKLEDRYVHVHFISIGIEGLSVYSYHSGWKF